MGVTAGQFDRSQKQAAYFVGTNPTPLTAIAFAINAAASETAGYYFSFQNNASDQAIKVYPDYIRLIQGATVPASAVSGHYFIKTDQSAGYTSGGSAITPVGCNSSNAAASIVALNAGALTTAARSSSARLVSRGVLRSAIPVANDEWLFKFGTSEASASSTLGGTAALRTTIPCPQIVLGKGHYMLMQLIFPSNAATAGQFEFELGWWEV